MSEVDSLRLVKTGRERSQIVAMMVAEQIGYP